MTLTFHHKNAEISPSVDAFLLRFLQPLRQLMPFRGFALKDQPAYPGHIPLVEVAVEGATLRIGPAHSAEIPHDESLKVRALGTMLTHRQPLSGSFS